MAARRTSENIESDWQSMINVLGDDTPSYTEQKELQNFNWWYKEYENALAT